MTRYRERLSPGVGIWLAFAVLVPAVTLMFAPLSIWLGIASAVVVYALAMLVAVGTAPVLEVTDTELRAGRARIDLALVGDTAAFRGSAATEQRGPRLDARAFRVMRGWVPGLVTVRIEDPADPTPYWAISTRHPERFARAIDEARAARG